jgi:hypothetical protein
MPHDTSAVRLLCGIARISLVWDHESHQVDLETRVECAQIGVVIDFTWSRRSVCGVRARVSVASLVMLCELLAREFVRQSCRRIERCPSNFKTVAQSDRCATYQNTNSNRTNHF